MVLLLISKNYPLDEVLYFESGCDFPCIEHNAKEMRKYCEEHGVRFTTVYPEEPFLYQMLQKPICKTDADGNIYYKSGYGFCGGPCRWGTGLKIKALREAYRKYGDEPIVEYIGITVTELQRINRRRDGNRVKLYPLVEWQYDEDFCLQYCHEHGIFWRAEPDNPNSPELYGNLDRISCWHCANKNLKELRFIRQEMPDIWARLMQLGERIGPYKKGVTVAELDARFAREEAMPQQLSLFE